MAIRALTYGDQVDYISKLDPTQQDGYEGDEKPTVFKLEVLDALILADLEDDAYEFEMAPDGGADGGGTKTQLHVNRRNVRLVKYGVCGWANFLDEDGNEIPFKTKPEVRNGRKCDVLQDSLVSMIPPAVVKELAEEIQKHNGLSEDAIKNSGSPSK